MKKPVESDEDSDDDDESDDSEDVAIISKSAPAKKAEPPKK